MRIYEAGILLCLKHSPFVMLAGAVAVGFFHRIFHNGPLQCGNESYSSSSRKKGDDYDEQISNIVDYYTRYIAIYILYKGINEIKKVNGAEDNRKT